MVVVFVHEWLREGEILGWCCWRRVQDPGCAVTDLFQYKSRRQVLKIELNLFFVWLPSEEGIKESVGFTFDQRAQTKSRMSLGGERVFGI